MSDNEPENGAGDGEEESRDAGVMEEEDASNQPDAIGLNGDLEEDENQNPGPNGSPRPPNNQPRGSTSTNRANVPNRQDRNRAQPQSINMNIHHRDTLFEKYCKTKLTGDNLEETPER